MKVTKLSIANLRAIEMAEFSFGPDLNLVVGVNGVGKSTILDAIRICMSRVLPSISESTARPIAFNISDIRVGRPFLDVSVKGELGDEEFSFTRRQWRERYAVDDEENIENLRRQILESERLRDRPRTLLRELSESGSVSDSDVLIPEKARLHQIAKSLSVAPNCIFFSTDRSVVSSERAAMGRAVGGKAAAYAEGLTPRSWKLRQFAEWMRAQAKLASELRVAARHLEVLRDVTTQFLPAYENVRPDDEMRLLIDSGDATLDVTQLSDGERGVLAMVLDLARRLSQANPDLGDPLREGEAVVLIDELDLHLHPSWQRQIVHKLTEVFPRCQFITTTHSPQVIGEVEHDQIQIIADGQVFSPSHSFGADSSRVLEEIMDTLPRTKQVQDLLSRLSREIGTHRYGDARASLVELIEQVGENDPEVTRARTLLEFMEGEM